MNKIKGKTYTEPKPHKNKKIIPNYRPVLCKKCYIAGVRQFYHDNDREPSEEELYEIGDRAIYHLRRNGVISHGCVHFPTTPKREEFVL